MADGTHAVILTHPAFDRPPVPQPNKRRKKGTINLQARRQAKQDRERQVRLDFIEDTFNKFPLYVRIPHDELDRVLKAGGLCRGFSFKDRCPIIMRDRAES